MNHKTFEKLLSNLVKEAKYQEKLLSLLTEERASIATLKTEKLSQIKDKKEKLLIEISAHSSERLNIVSDLGFTPTPKGKNNNFKISDCISTCSDKSLREKLNKVCSELSSCAKSVKKLNADNGDLLRTSLGLVSNTISIINARPTIDDTNYKRDGKVGSLTDKAKNTSVPVSSFSKSA
jgi:flagellar biosynthesis/type III secretory pathway chaperone